MSSENSRPGGLTALAVLNFIFSAFAILGGFGNIFAATSMQSDPEGPIAKALKESGATPEYLFAMAGLGVLIGALLIVSGVGYLKQKKMIGRTVGTIYAVVSIASGIINLLMLQQDFSLFMLIGFIYPVLTLILLNTTFKDDFVNP